MYCSVLEAAAGPGSAALLQPATLHYCLQPATGFSGNSEDRGRVKGAAGATTQSQAPGFPKNTAEVLPERLATSALELAGNNICRGRIIYAAYPPLTMDSSNYSH